MDLKPHTPLPPGMVPSASREDLSGIPEEEQDQCSKDIVREVKLYAHMQLAEELPIQVYPCRVTLVRDLVKLALVLLPVSRGPQLLEPHLWCGSPHLMSRLI